MSNAKLSFALEYIGELVDDYLFNHSDAEKYIQFMITNLEHESPLVREGAIIGLEKIVTWSSPKNREAANKIKKMSKEDPCLPVRQVCDDYVESEKEFRISSAIKTLDASMTCPHPEIVDQFEEKFFELVDNEEEHYEAIFDPKAEGCSCDGIVARLYVEKYGPSAKYAEKLKNADRKLIRLGYEQGLEDWNEKE